MKSIFLVILTALIGFSCSTQSTEKATSADSTKNTIAIENSSDSTELAKQWLIKSIEGYFNNNDSTDFCTKRYNEYKEDASNVDYDGGMSEAEFTKKWQGIYDTKFAGLGVGFLISGQDFGTIKVSSCELKSKTPDGYTFKTIIEDKDNHVKYNRDIRIIRNQQNFLIDDVLEYD